jgi:glutamyl-tRNA synthetase/glutamyl-Q tRNA(Asp) synthetase
VLLRIEDHDRQRSRPEYDAALLEDLAWLGFVPDEGPVRQSDDDGPYLAALDRLRAAGLVYACDCSRTDMAGWNGPGCARDCRLRPVAGERAALRVDLGGGGERWSDAALGPSTADVAAHGDVPIRDRHGNWTYNFAVVVDDLRQGVGLVVRGEDLVDATGAQIRLARALAREEPATFLHHPLIRKPGGAKLSKADGDTGVRAARAGGERPERLIARAAASLGLVERERDIAASDVTALFMRRDAGRVTMSACSRSAIRTNPDEAPPSSP